MPRLLRSSMVHCRVQLPSTGLWSVPAESHQTPTHLNDQLVCFPSTYAYVSQTVSPLQVFFCHLFLHIVSLQWVIHVPPTLSPSLDTAGTVYHLVIYMHSNKIHRVFFNEWVYSSRMLARHVSDLTGPSSGAFYKLYLQIWYVVLLCVLLDTSSRYEVVESAE